MGKDSDIFLTARQTANLIIFSKKYSQGSPSLENGLFYAAHLLNPNLRIPARANSSEDCDPDFMEEVVELATPVIRRRIQAVPKPGMAPRTNLRRTHPVMKHEPYEHTYQHVDANIRNSLFEIYETFTRDDPQDEANKRTVLWETMKSIISQDRYFLIERGGRFRQEVNTRSADGDPWLSHIVYYGFMGNPTEIPQFTQIFREVTKYAVEVLEDPHKSPWAYRPLSEVIQVYNQRHKPIYPCIEPLNRT